jgi:methyl-accepting chemotaxis protein
MDLINEQRLKGMDYSLKGAISTIAFCVVIEIVFLLGYIFKFLTVSWQPPLIAGVVLVFGVIIYFLCRKNVISWVMPYLVTTTTTLALTIALGFVNPVIRIPFFLIYFYIVFHPAVLLGLSQGLYAVILVDVSYCVMIFATRGLYPDMNIGLELVKLLFFTFITLMLILDFDKNLKRIQNIRRLIGLAEQGDYSVVVKDTERDEIAFLGGSVNKLVESQTGLIRLIIETTKTLSDMSEQMAKTANEMSTSITNIVQTTQGMTQGTTEQFSELDRTIQVGKSLSEISFEVVNNVKKIEESSLNVSKRASSALSQSDVVVQNIELIGNRYSSLITLMNKLQNISSTISKIVETINAISEKINILSLNASIEAARAGEYGRGFSIVADEVKKLADNTQASASEINSIINEMTESITVVMKSGEEVNRAIASGSIEIKSTTDSLRNISNQVLELNTAIKSIKEIISREEKEITNIIGQVERSHTISKDNSSAAEEVLASLEEQSAATQQFSATSEELVAVASKLKDMVKSINLGEKEKKID